MFTFHILGWECPFRANLGKYGPKNQNRQFKLKFGTWTNSIIKIQWWCSLFHFWLDIPFLKTSFCLWLDTFFKNPFTLFLEKNRMCRIQKKIRTANLRWKLVLRLIQIFESDFHFFVLDCKYPFWVNSVQKIKMVSLNWILVPRLF